MCFVATRFMRDYFSAHPPPFVLANTGAAQPENKMRNLSGHEDIPEISDEAILKVKFEMIFY